MQILHAFSVGEWFLERLSKPGYTHLVALCHAESFVLDLIRCRMVEFASILDR